MKKQLRLTLALLIASTILSACSTLTALPDSIQKNRELTNLYQHRWINTANPHVDQNLNSVAKYLSKFDVVFFGELHGHSGVHLAQMQLFEAMFTHNPQLSLSLEQFERDTQLHVDEYLAGKIGEKVLIKKARAWDNYPTSYRPLIEFAKKHQLPVVAANAPKSSVSCVGRLGLVYLNSLSTQDRQYVAQDIDISDGDYRKKYMSFLTNNSSHGSTSSDDMSDMMKQMSQRSFSAQVVRDDTMAESIALHLQQNPRQQVLHLNGGFHSSNFLGTVERLIHRIPDLKVAVIDTVTLALGDESWKSDELNNGNLLLLVDQLPDGFVNEDNEKEWSKSILKIRMKSGAACEPTKQPPPDES